MSDDSLKIAVENIQSIVEAAIEVSGFTGIVGKSNIGKSALIRGLLAALTNKAPKSIFREGTKESNVKIDDDQNNIHIEWRRSGVTSLNEYVINGDKHTKVGKEPPQQVLDWGFKPIKINDEWLDIQFSKQFSPPFLLNQSGSYVADFISKITKADILTGAMKDCEADLRKNADTVKHTDKEIEKYAEDLKRFVDVDYFQERSKLFLDEKNEIYKQNGEISLLNKDIEQLELLVTEKSKLSYLPEGVAISFDVLELQKIAQWIDEISVLKESYLKSKKVEESKLPEVSFDLETLGVIEQYLQLQGKANFATPELPVVDVDFSSIEKIDALILELNSVVTDREQTNKQLKDLIEKVDGYEKEKAKIEKALGKCPLCSSDFNTRCQTHEERIEITV